jgi:transposase
MMGIKDRRFDPLPYDVSLEDLVPRNSFYRQLEEKLDLSFVRELVDDLYAASGRPSIDPEVFFRLQLVMFHEGIRSERELMRIVSDRISVRWYVGYDHFEELPDDSSLTRIRYRFGLSVFREFFERIVELCVEVGLVWDEELYLEATKVDANASLDSITPRFFVEQHLGELFTEDEPFGAEQEEVGIIVAAEQSESPVAELHELPSASDAALIAENAAKDDWISRNGHQRRENKGVFYRRRADLLVSKTDPDSSPMKRKDSKGSHLDYYDHYVVDGGMARIILNVLVTPFEITENQPMLDLLWRTSFRYKLRPKRVTGDTAYGTIENIAAVERVGIRAYVPLTRAGKARPYFSKEEFVYDPQKDLYRCHAEHTLRRFSDHAARRLTKYRADTATCAGCSLRPQCTKSKRGREVLHYYDEDYVDRVKSYFGTFAYEKALRKRKVWVEPMFAEAKDWHGLRRFRLRRLVKVNIEALMIAVGQNIKRLLTFGRRKPKSTGAGIRSAPVGRRRRP